MLASGPEKDRPADFERVLGADHPNTLSRGNLASAYQAAGRTAEAIPLFKIACGVPKVGHPL